VERGSLSDATSIRWGEPQRRQDAKLRATRREEREIHKKIRKIRKRILLIF
jgi:hypothetical protein